MPKKESIFSRLFRIIEEFPAIRLVKKDGLKLQSLPEKFKGRKKVVLVAVKQDGLALQYAGEKLKKNEEFIKELKNLPNVDFLQHVPQSWKKDWQFFLEFIQKSPDALKYVDDTFKADQLVVVKAVTGNGIALKHASETLKADKEVVLVAVGQNGIALKHASETLKADKEVVLEAVKKHPMFVYYAADTLRGDDKFITELATIVKKNPAVKSFFKSSWLTNEEFMSKLTKNLNQCHQVLALNHKNRHSQQVSRDYSL